MPITTTITGLEKLDKLARDFEEAGHGSRRLVRSIVREIGMGVLSSVKEASPVASGSFQSSWRMSMVTIGDTTRIRIVNNAVHAPAIEFGSEPGQSPWPVASKGQARTKDSKGKLRKKPSGKTVKRDGKIWSSQAIGGVLKNVFPATRVKSASKDIENAIVASLGKLNGK